MKANQKTKDWYVIEGALNTFLHKSQVEEEFLLQEYENLCELCGKTAFAEDSIDYMFSHMPFCSELIDNIGNAVICMQMFSCLPKKYLKDVLYVCKYTKETKGFTEEEIINILINQ